MSQLPLGQTTLLIAGPRAGKTSLLLRWREASTAPTQYFRLTPEDGERAFALRRLLKDWPSIRMRFDAIRDELGTSGWGGALGMAIAEAHPEFCLLLDDFHLSETMAEAEDWQGLVRHFPSTGTLVVASRHRLSEHERAPLVVWDADYPEWKEAPGDEHLAALPPELLAWAIVLYVVEEAAPSEAGLELVRRNIAERLADGSHRLRPAWRDAAAAAAASRPGDRALWEAVEAELRAYSLRNLGKWKQQAIPGILARIPGEVRERSPFLVQSEGDLLAEAQQLAEARACYQRAQGLNPSTEARRELLLRELAVAARLMDAPASRAVIEALTAEPTPLTAHEEVSLLYWRGFLEMQDGHLDQARESYSRALGIPTSGDRRIMRRHASAMRFLVGLHCEQGELGNALSLAERLVTQSLAFDIQRELLNAYGFRWGCLLLDESQAFPFKLLVDVPSEAFRHPDPLALNHYLTSFAGRAFRIKQYDLALRLFNLALAQATAQHLTVRVLAVKHWLALTHARMGDVAIARRYYDELRTLSPYERMAATSPLQWSYLLILTGRLDEAEQLLRDEQWVTALNRARGELHLGWIRALRGDKSAPDAIRALLATPEGAPLYHTAAELLGELGLRDSPSFYHLRTFGPTAFQRAGAPAPRWPRKKALSLLALLALHPNGVDGRVVLDALYQGSESADPAGALRTLAYNLRQVLTPLGAAELLEVNRGFYRFKWEAVAHCDLHEFETLYQQGQAFEAAGHLETAAVFYRLALQLPQGELFEDLDEAVFDAPRREHAARVAHARAMGEPPGGQAAR